MTETTSVLDDADAQDFRRLFNWTDYAETAEKREVFAKRLFALGATADTINNRGSVLLLLLMMMMIMILLLLLLLLFVSDLAKDGSACMAYLRTMSQCRHN